MLLPTWQETCVYIFTEPEYSEKKHTILNKEKFIIAYFFYLHWESNLKLLYISTITEMHTGIPINKAKN